MSRALSAHRGRAFPGAPLLPRAAVAAVLAPGEGGGGVDLLFIRRSERPGDPWSGHMAFPGGRVEPGDAGPRAAALRETREETGLDLVARARPLGRLSDLLARTHARPLPMIVTPYLYLLDRPLAAGALRTNHEVAEAVAVPLGFFCDLDRNRESLRWPFFGIPLHLPCYRWEGRTIWGLTLEMVDEMLVVLGAATDAQLDRGRLRRIIGAIRRRRRRHVKRARS